ncbi:mite allergen Der f 3-like [Battus philenor]|uniref:mite allergen Der f 3-like n=1 Tax=Battus philenor TaxID=42288 RepID=UPI0035CEEFE7
MICVHLNIYFVLLASIFGATLGNDAGISEASEESGYVRRPIKDSDVDPLISEHSKKMWNITSVELQNLLKNYNDSCQPLKYEVPDFRAEGRRISEVKCLEYMWQIRSSVESSARDFECSLLGPLLEPVVVGGIDAEVGELPHMGAIGWRGISPGTWLFKCGGVLISEKFVLTVAHCSRVSRLDTTVSDPVPKIVRFGVIHVTDTKNYELPPTDIEISRWIVHDNYRAPKTYNDIALVELKKQLVFRRRIHPACLWTSESDITGKATLSGWGVVDTASRATSSILQIATVDMIPSEQCNKTLTNKRNRHWVRGLDWSQICAGYSEGGVDACQGDSGGPLQVEIDMDVDPLSKWRLYNVVGLTSFGFGCAHANTPSVFTRVASFTQWIENIVWKNEVNETSV